MAIPPQEVSTERARVSWPEIEERGASIEAPRAVASLRIRQIEIVGFKSFRDRTVLHFQPGVTGIVGPNGCGKSNVVDAIRWVLGEQSAKRLRGEGMEDVIFGGNDRHSPLGMAQVSVVFETDGLPVDQFSLLKESGHPLVSAAAADIMVTRRYLRSGESEYLLNGAPCRLRDVTELFLGTGLGGRAYAIIEQGRVEQLVGAKPDELRLFIEEAAGTTLYRSRRQIAERKMERTRENLLRVQDILREVERQLSVLRRQAKRAEQYRSLLAEIEELDLALAANQRARFASELDELMTEREAALSRDGELTNALSLLEVARQDARAREKAAQELIHEARRAAAEAQGACESARHEMARLEARASELAAQNATTDADLTTAVRERASAVAEHGSGVDRLAELARTVGEIEQSLCVAEGELAHASEQAQGAADALDEARNMLVEAMTEETRARNELAAAAQRRIEEHARLERLEAGLETAAERHARAAAEAERNERALIELRERLQALEGSKRHNAEDLRAALAVRSNWEQTLEGIKEGLGRVRSRRDTLRELQDTHAGYGEGVRAVLAAASPGEVLGVAAEILEIPDEYERAVAAVLGEQLQSVIVQDHRAARDAITALRLAGAGRATCVPRVPRSCAPNADLPDGSERLLDCVRLRPGYEEVGRALLERAVVTPDLEAALAMWEALPFGWTLVTMAGETVDSSGAISGGTQRSEATILAQRRELRLLEQELRRREEEFAEARERLDELSHAVRVREDALRGIDAELAQVAIALVAAEKDFQRVGQELNEVQEESKSIGLERDETGARLEALDAELERLTASVEEVGQRREEFANTVHAAETKFRTTQAAVAGARSEVTDRKVALAAECARRDALVSDIERMVHAEQETERRVARLEERRQVDGRALEEARGALWEVGARLGMLEETAAARFESVADAERHANAAREAAELAEREAAGAQRELGDVRGRVAAMDVQAAERRLAISHLEQTIRDRYQRDVPVAVEADQAGGDGEREEQLSRLRQRVSALGDVNVAALSEVAELEERQGFLNAQRVDLEGALEDLRKTIARLNRTSRARFRETFEKVDATFRSVFPKLFQGGKAYLRLTDEEQILESGIEIVVQPPGKRVGSLDLLSGGEKALTAVSLIFALFLVKPSPFCFLDEVDAPLDDANIGRFNAMVREMSAQSQFILITHNRRTMEAAETLYGVTMEEPGVSKIVSVRMPG